MKYNNIKHWRDKRFDLTKAGQRTQRDHHNMTN